MVDNDQTLEIIYKLTLHMFLVHLALSLVLEIPEGIQH